MSGKTSFETSIYTCGTENPHLKTPINLHGERSLGNNFTYPTFIHTHYRKPQNRCEWEHNICMEAQGKQNRVETWPP